MISRTEHWIVIGSDVADWHIQQKKKTNKQETEERVVVCIY